MDKNINNIEDYENKKGWVDRNKKKLEKLLNEHAKQFLKETYDMSLEVQIDINGRLSSTLGYYKCWSDEPIAISISKRLLISEQENSEELSLVVQDVLEHELIHYALHMQGKPFSDNDMEFINECLRLGVGLTGEHDIIQPLEHYVCESGHDLFSTKKVDTKRYTCGKCRGRIKHEGKTILK